MGIDGGAIRSDKPVPMKALGFIASLSLAFAAGFVVAIMTPAAAAPPAQEARSNMDLLGEFHTVTDPDDPFVAKLRADDLANGRTDKGPTS